MVHALEDIAKTLKKARQGKGLTQRALGELSGVRQYQISKIENGAVDLRVSSLIQLARALDLDLKLVPRKAVPAIDSVVRSTMPRASAAPAIKEVNRVLNAVKSLRVTYPDLGELNKLQKAIQSVSNSEGIGKQLEALREISKPIREMQKLSETPDRYDTEFRALREAASIPVEQLRALQQATKAVQNLRNLLVHDISEAPSRPRPLYSLDDNDDA